MAGENFVQVVTTVFENIEKVHEWLFFGQFRLFLESQPYDINVIAHIGPPLSEIMAVESFVRIVTTVFETNCNSSQLAVPWSISAMFLKSQLYDINVIAHIGPPYKVKWLSKFSFESLRQFLKKM